MPQLVLFLLLALTTPAFASDGVLEINQTCAVQSGCFSGDSAGFPVTIDGSAGRSYRLTGDLVLPDLNTTGIRVETHDVGIDLGGFTIISAGCVAATTSSCRASAGFGHGVAVDDSALRHGLSLHNGSIVGMGSQGATLGLQAEVTDLRVRWNGDLGIMTSAGSTITGNTAWENGGGGISAGPNSTVTGNTARLNVYDGIFAQGNCTISENTSSFNTDDGIHANSSNIFGNTTHHNGADGVKAINHSRVSGNTSEGNDRYGIYGEVGNHVEGNVSSLNDSGGIFVGNGNSVSGNTVWGNGVNSSGSRADGIFANGGSTVSHNTARENTGHGISVNGPSNLYGNTSILNARRGLRMQSNVAYGQNVVAGNGEGNIESGLQMGQNFCETNLTCP